MAERTTPVVAAIAALSTLACCLPLSFLAAVGLAGASARLQSFRPSLLGSAAVLLGIGFIQSAQSMPKAKPVFISQKGNVP
jgi:hypothetical protein